MTDDRRLFYGFQFKHLPFRIFAFDVDFVFFVSAKKLQKCAAIGCEHDFLRLGRAAIFGAVVDFDCGKLFFRVVD